MRRLVRRITMLMAAVGVAAASVATASPAVAAPNEGTFRFENFHNGLCADVDNASIDDWARVKQWPCRDWDPQRWNIRFVEREGLESRYTIYNVKSLKCLDLPWGDPSQGLIQHSCWGGDMQLWAIESAFPHGDGFLIRNIAAYYQCLSVDTAAGAGASLVVKPCAITQAQRWRFLL